MPIGIVAGWCATAADLDEARQATHDILIELQGDRRRGPVTWRIFGQRLDALEVLARMRRLAGNSPALDDHYAALAELIGTHGGILVIAIAPGEIP